MGSEPNETSFIDTNIWLYAFLESEPHAKFYTARALLRSTNPIISTQVVNEVCVNLIRRASFSEDQVRRLVQSFYANYRVVEFNRFILLRASRLRVRYSLSFWDSLIVASALQVGATVLYSEDMQHNQVIEGDLQILNPFT